ncbi:unnamed protein product [Phaeothamnion confervicola]
MESCSSGGRRRVSRDTQNVWAGKGGATTSKSGKRSAESSPSSGKKMREARPSPTASPGRRAQQVLAFRGARIRRGLKQHGNTPWSLLESRKRNELDGELLTRPVSRSLFFPKTSDE